MYPCSSSSSSSSTINICNFIYNNTPIPTSPMQYEDEHVLLQHIHTLLLQQEDSFAAAAAAAAAAESAIILNSNEQYFDNSSSTMMMMKNNSNNSNNVVVVGKKKKCSKKDRHSKIHTAHGPRDRRMRLSLDVARKFFDLQDMLGFDKASKTVDWLLLKSRLAIKDLKQQNHCAAAGGGASAASSTSECEAASGVLDQEFEPPMGGDNVAAAGKLPKMGAKEKKGAAKAAGRIRAAFYPLSKESRNKARERARERTKMKMKKKKNNMLGETPPQEMGGATHNVKTTNDQALPPTAAEELATSHIHEHNWSLCNIFHSHQNPPAATSHQNQFGEFPYSGKFWESYNDGNL